MFCDADTDTEVTEQVAGPGGPLRRTMQAMLTCVDEATWNLTQALKRHGLWEQTLMVW
jgi:arylsulfatase A-like enzyme